MSEPAFPPATRAQWQAQAERELGRSVDSLTRTTLDGLPVAPLIMHGELASASGRLGLGTRATARWHTVQEYRHADPQAANRAARRDLELGADGLWLFVDAELRAGRSRGTPATGLACAPTQASLDRLLEGIDPTRTPVFLDAGLLAPAWADALEEWLDAHSEPGPEPAVLGRGPARGGVVYDPLTPLLRTGSLERGFAAALGELVDAMLGRTVGLIGVSTTAYHDAGAGDAEELALALSTCAELLRRGEALGLEPEDLASGLLWTVAVAGRPFEAIAKLRAARVCWAKFAAACGLAPDQRALWIHATSSVRGWSRHSPWVNLLRGTIGSFAAAVGGADSIATASFDGLCGPEPEALEGLGRGSELGRRLAIDTQVILRKESACDRVLDPAGGSGSVEALTDALARAAWQRFRELEASGGLVANLCSGAIQRGLAANAELLRERVATRELPLTGVSSYPVLDDQPPPAQEPNRFDGEGPELLSTSPVLDPAEVEALPRLRLAAAFERLRDASEAWAERPRIYALNLGPLATHSARADFAANAFAAGGLEVVRSEGFAAVEPAIAGFRASGCALVVVCGHDRDYASLAAALVPALRSAGAARVWIAGRPPDDPHEWGSPEFVFLGADILANCELALRTLGVLAGEQEGGR
jgi:methylmalonyl-CoA mutase